MSADITVGQETGEPCVTVDVSAQFGSGAETYVVGYEGRIVSAPDSATVYDDYVVGFLYSSWSAEITIEGSLREVNVTDMKMDFDYHDCDE